MPFDNDDLPVLSDALMPPIVRGTADLTSRAYTGTDLDALLAAIRSVPSDDGGFAGPSAAARLFDTSIAYQLGFRRAEGLERQERALAAARVFRIAGKAGGGRGRLRVLALCAPGDLMVNTPLDFMTNELDVRLDLLFIRANEPLPPSV